MLCFAIWALALLQPAVLAKMAITERPILSNDCIIQLLPAATIFNDAVLANDVTAKIAAYTEDVMAVIPEIDRLGDNNIADQHWLEAEVLYYLHGAVDRMYEVLFLPQLPAQPQCEIGVRSGTLASNITRTWYSAHQISNDNVLEALRAEAGDIRLCAEHAANTSVALERYMLVSGNLAGFVHDRFLSRSSGVAIEKSQLSGLWSNAPHRNGRPTASVQTWQRAAYQSVVDRIESALYHPPSLDQYAHELEKHAQSLVQSAKSLTIVEQIDLQSTREALIGHFEALEQQYAKQRAKMDKLGASAQ